MATPTNLPQDALDLLPGKTVAGKYRVERLIGRGGMGAVFQATNTSINKRVALKFLSEEAARDHQSAQRFQREAEAASLAESEHIVQIFDFGATEEGLPFLVMELLAGSDLRARLKQHQRLSPEVAVGITLQVLRALNRAHAAGIVHRDLKPDNVFLCQRDSGEPLVKIVDFGISKLARRATLDTLTRRGTILGTAFYMSPEQAQGIDEVDARADLYSVGAILYEMLAGRPPHQAPTYEAILIAICTRDADDVRLHAPEVSEALSRVISRSLARDRAQRYGTASEFARALESALAGRVEPSLRSAEAVEIPTAVASYERAQKLRTRVAGLVALLLGFAITAIWIGRKPKSIDPESSASASTLTGAAPDPVPEVPGPTKETTLPAAVEANVAPTSPSAAHSDLAPHPSASHKKPVSSATASATGRPKSGVASTLELNTKGP